jgi:hypothetical protein
MAKPPQADWYVDRQADRHTTRRSMRSITIYVTPEEFDAVTRRAARDGITKQEAGRKLFRDYGWLRDIVAGEGGMVEPPQADWYVDRQADRHTTRRSMRTIAIYVMPEEFDAVTRWAARDGITKQEAGRQLFRDYGRNRLYRRRHQSRPESPTEESQTPLPSGS